jgi:hypothetical protein
VHYDVVGLFPLRLEGLGVTSISRLLEWRCWGNAQGPRLSYYTRVVLVTTATLLASGTLSFWVAEFAKSLADFSWTERLLVSNFLAVPPHGRL